MTQGSVVGDQDGRRDLSTSKDEQVSKDSGNLKNELPFVKDRLRAWDLVFADMNADRWTNDFEQQNELWVVTFSSY